MKSGFERSNTVLDSESQVAKARTDTKTISTERISSETGDMAKNRQQAGTDVDVFPISDQFSTNDGSSTNKPPASTGYGRQPSRGSIKTTGSLDKTVNGTKQQTTHNNNNEKPKKSSSQGGKDSKSDGKSSIMHCYL